jgi:hypothetical protein
LLIVLLVLDRGRENLIPRLLLQAADIPLPEMGAFELCATVTHLLVKGRATLKEHPTFTPMNDIHCTSEPECWSIVV